MFVCAALGTAFSADRMAWLGVLILGGLGSLSCWVAYATSGYLKTSELGIEHRRFGMVRRLAWQDVESIREKWGGLQVSGKSVTLRIEQQLSGYLDLYAELRRQAPQAFSPLLRVPFTLPAFRILWGWMGPSYLALNAWGIYGLASGHETGASIALILISLIFGAGLGYSLPLRFHFGETSLRVEYAMRREVHLWRDLQAASIGYEASQLTLTLRFASNKTVRLPASPTKAAPQEIYDAMNAIWSRTPAPGAEPEVPSLSRRRRALVWLSTLWTPLLGLAVYGWFLQQPPNPELWPWLWRGVWLSLTMFGLAASLPALVRLLAACCRDNPARLIAVFQPLLIFMVTVVALMAIAQSVIVSTCLHLMASRYLDRGMEGLALMLVGLGLLFATILARHLWRSLRAPGTVSVLGCRAVAQDALTAEVLRIAAALGTPAPHQIILGLEPGFFVTELPLDDGREQHEGRSLYLPIGILPLLAPAELTAILAHELAHFAGDTSHSRRLGPLWYAIASASSVVGAAGNFLLLPVAAALEDLLQQFNGVHRAWNQKTERIADAAAARLVGDEVNASALVRLTFHEPAWWQVADQHPEAADLTECFALHQSARLREPGTLEELLARDAVTEPHHSHPSLAERLELLGQSPSQNMLTMPQSGDASIWVAGFEAIAVELTERWRAESQDTPRQQPYLYLPGSGRGRITFVGN